MYRLRGVKGEGSDSNIVGSRGEGSQNVYTGKSKTRYIVRILRYVVI